MELPILGGFFHGDNYNYMFFGQENPSESDSVEVVRIVKYDENFNKISHTGVYGENTEKPFSSGSLRAAQKGEKINILTSHRMYKSSDGRNHQANMFIQYDESSEEITGVNSDVSFASTGYTSHSFNQFIITDSMGNIVTANHGDAYPRTFTLHRFKNSTKEASDWNTEIDVFAGATGANYTGASLGGLVETNGAYLLAANKNPSDAQGLSRNVILYSVSKSNLKKVDKIKISNYNESSKNRGATTPHLVQAGSNSGYVLWNEKGKDTLNYSSYTATGDSLSVGATMTADKGAYLSDCKPIIANSKITWYTTDGKEPVFYSLDPSTSSISTVSHVLAGKNETSSKPSARPNNSMEGFGFLPYGDNIKLVINGNYVYSDVDPFIENSRTLVPLRVISENLGIGVKWEQSTKQVLLDHLEGLAVFTIGVPSYRAKGVINQSDVAPKIVNSRTFVPIRVIAELFDRQVDWDARTRTVYIGDK